MHTWLLRRRILAVGCGALILALAAGCASAQPAATPAPSYVNVFGPMMPAPNEIGKFQYTTVLGPVAGRGARTFSVPVRPGYSLWFGCLGKGGVLTVKSPALDLDTGLPCSSNGQLSGWVFNPPRRVTGTSAVLRVGAPPHSRWELRLDAAPPSA